MSPERYVQREWEDEWITDPNGNQIKAPKEVPRIIAEVDTDIMARVTCSHCNNEFWHDRYRDDDLSCKHCGLRLKFKLTPEEIERQKKEADKKTGKFKGLSEWIEGSNTYSLSGWNEKEMAKLIAKELAVHLKPKKKAKKK